MAAASPAELTLCPHPPPPSIHALEAVPVGSADGPVWVTTPNQALSHPSALIIRPPRLALQVYPDIGSSKATSTIAPQKWSMGRLARWP